MTAMTDREDAQLDDLIASTTLGATDDAAALAAFARAIGDSLKLPIFGLVLGERVQLDGVELARIRRGIVAKLRKGGRSWRVSLLDVVLPGRSRGVLLVRAYQRWAGAPASQPEHLATAAELGRDLDRGGTIESVVLKVGAGTARVRPLGEDQEITLRGSSSDLWNAAPGQIVTVRVSKRWTHRGFLYMSGAIETARIDVPALGLRPLSLHRRASQTFELERVIPGADESLHWDMLDQATELHVLRDQEGAEKILMDLLHADLRCLEAHALLGEWVHEASHEFLAKRALPHFEVGIGIAELSLGPSFNGHLPWRLVGNQAFLRCLQGYGMALWRFGRLGEATRVLDRLGALDPDDTFQARRSSADLAAGRSWADRAVRK